MWQLWAYFIFAGALLSLVLMLVYKTIQGIHEVRTGKCKDLKTFFKGDW